jgi:hypothetical protein
MDDNTNTDGDVLLLTDEAGNMYAIPREALERHRVSGEEKARWEQLTGDEVSGYSMYQSYLNEQQTGYRQAERRQEGADARMVRAAARAGSEGADAQDMPETGAFFGRFVAMLRQPEARAKQAG